MNNKLTITAFSLLISLSSFSHATDSVYKWIDDRGITHYAESPPDDKNTKVRAQILNINTYVPRDSAAAIQKLEQQRTEKSEPTKKESKEGIKKTGETAKVDTSKAKAEYKDRCAQYKKDLDALTSKGDNVRIQEASGEQRRMTAEEISKKTDETQRNIKAFCE